MQFALVANERSEPFAGGKGSCPTCGAPMVAKCGPRVLHHWAHLGRRNCDPWWENETDWHREWKNRFPEAWREVSHVAPDGEIHRADIETPAGIVIEVQHSQMTDAERMSREAFYQNLVWIIDGRGFAQNFDLYHLLPHPESDLAGDIVWIKATRPERGTARGLFFRLSENRKHDPSLTKATLKYGWLHGIHEIEEAVNRSYRGHQQFDWVRPRRTWLEAACPVYLDFGDDCLFRIETYDESGLQCVFRVAKRKFVYDALRETSARAIATRFFPLPSEETESTKS